MRSRTMALGDRRRWGNTIAVIVILSVIVILLVVDSSMITIVSFYRDRAPMLYNWMMR